LAAGSPFVRDVELELLGMDAGAGAAGVCNMNKPTAATTTTTPMPRAMAQVGKPPDWALVFGSILRGDMLFPF
jgi:hypothetical protein